MGIENQKGPFLATAVICEKVLREQDGVISLIRIVDRVTRAAAGINPPKDMAPFDWQGNLVITLKKGRAQASMTLRMAMLKPSGELKPPIEQTVYFEGEEDNGITAHIGLQLKFEIPGLYWFRLFLDDQFLTQVPLRVVYLRQTQPAQSSG